MEQADERIQKVFSNAKYHPELSLTDDIWRLIISREQRTLRLKVWVYAALGLLSFITLFPVVASLIRQFAQSGFSEYLSLGFSDAGSITLYWKELVLTLADALPVSALILSLSLVVLFLICIRRAMRYFKNPLYTMKYI